MKYEEKLSSKDTRSKIEVGDPIYRGSSGAALGNRSGMGPGVKIKARSDIL